MGAPRSPAGCRCGPRPDSGVTSSPRLGRYPWAPVDLLRARLRRLSPPRPVTHHRPPARPCPAVIRPVPNTCPEGSPTSTFALVRAVQSNGLRSRERRFESCRGHSSEAYSNTLTILSRLGARPVTCGDAVLSQALCPIRARIPPPDRRVPLLSGGSHSRPPSRSATAGRCSWHLCCSYAVTADTVPWLPRTSPSNPARDLPARRGQPVAVAASPYKTTRLSLNSPRK
jgi:hypothetical protein